MYERFFGLDDAPFRLTPDPRYLFLSSKHAEALGSRRWRSSSMNSRCTSGMMSPDRRSSLGILSEPSLVWR